jgi:hypothetical protein
MSLEEIFAYVLATTGRSRPLVRVPFGLAEVLGTALGLLPGLVLTSAFVDRAIAAVVSPSPQTLATLVIVVAAIVALAVALRRRFAAKA